MFHYTVETPKSIDETVLFLEHSLRKRNFGVLWQLDIPSKLQEKGVDFIQPYRVLEVCNPFEAQKVLTRNSLVGYFLPCKLVVYQDLDQHTTKIGLTRPTVLMEILNDETLKEIAQQIEETLMEAIQEAR